MKIRSLAALAAAAVSLTACEGIKEALTAHVDVVARAEDHELGVTRLSDLLGNSTLQIPVNRETATIVTDLWVNYHLLAVAAAKGDSLNDPKLIDEAAQGITANVRLRRFMESVGPALKGDTATEASYNQAVGGVLAARHILFAFPGGASQQQKDSVRRRAETVRGQVTSGNFGDMAKRHSADPGSATRGGDLGAFGRDEMVKPFSDAVAALRPGEISSLVETQYGYHIIQRQTYANAREQYAQTFSQRSAQRAESVYIAGVDQDSRINLKAGAGAVAKSAVRDMSANRRNDDVMATYKGGDLTVAEFLRWVESFPPQMRITQQMAQAPDSLVREFVKSIARNEVLLAKADSAGIKMTAEETQQLQAEFRSIVTNLWQQLGIHPAMLDSARNAAERDRLAASRVDAFLDRVLAGQQQPVSVPKPIEVVLTSKYSSKVNSAGIDRAVERASKLRASADSARSAQQPRSQVPLPTPPAGPPDTTAAKTKRP